MMVNCIDIWTDGSVVTFTNYSMLLGYIFSIRCGHAKIPQLLLFEYNNQTNLIATTNTTRNILYVVDDSVWTLVNVDGIYFGALDCLKCLETYK